MGTVEWQENRRVHRRRCHLELPLFVQRTGSILRKSQSAGKLRSESKRFLGRKRTPRVVTVTFNRRSADANVTKNLGKIPPPQPQRLPPIFPQTSMSLPEVQLLRELPRLVARTVNVPVTATTARTSRQRYLHPAPAIVPASSGKRIGVRFNHRRMTFESANQYSSYLFICRSLFLYFQ